MTYNFAGTVTKNINQSKSLQKTVMVRSFNNVYQSNTCILAIDGMVY